MTTSKHDNTRTTTTTTRGRGEEGGGRCEVFSNTSHLSHIRD